MVPEPEIRSDDGATGPDFRDRALDWLAPETGSGSAAPLWLDAATGAGNMTLRMARRLLATGGRLVTVDLDPESWTHWAEPKLREAGLVDRVAFHRCDLVDLSILRQPVDAVVCDLTLSTMGPSAAEALLEFTRVLKPGGRLAIYDYLPQSPATSPEEALVNRAWRLYKAVAVLSGEPHYEEVPPELWQRLLHRVGYEVVSHLQDPRRPGRSEEGLQEWLDTPLKVASIPEPELRRVIAATHRHHIDEVQRRGAMLRWCGTFLILAVKQ